jgi:hypothetical protein
MTNDEGMTKRNDQLRALFSSFKHSDLFRHSSFVIHRDAQLRFSGQEKRCSNLAPVPISLDDSGYEQ